MNWGSCWFSPTSYSPYRYFGVNSHSIVSFKSCLNYVQQAALIYIQVNIGGHDRWFQCNVVTSLYPATQVTGDVPPECHRARPGAFLAAGRLRASPLWPDLNKVYPQKADDTLHNKTLLSRSERRKNITNSRYMMRLMSLPWVVFPSVAVNSYCSPALHSVFP